MRSGIQSAARPRCKRLAALLCVVSLVFSMSGCADYRKLSGLMFVAGIALDRVDGGVQATLELVLVSSDKSSGQRAVHVSGEGADAGAAIYNCAHEFPGSLYLGHCQAVIVGEETAREGIADIVSFILQNQSLLPTTTIFVAKGMTGGEMIQKEPLSGGVLSFSLNTFLTSAYQGGMGSVARTTIAIHNAMHAPGHGAVAAALSADGEEDAPPQFDGLAVFRRDKLAGFLTPRESNLLSLLRGAPKNVVLEEPSGGASALVESSRLQYAPRLDAETPALDMTLSVRASLIHAPQTGDAPAPAVTAQQEEMFSACLERELGALLQKLQKTLRCDLAGAFEALAFHSRTKAVRVSEDWEDVYPDMEGSLSAEVSVVNAGLMLPARAPASDSAREGEGA